MLLMCANGCNQICSLGSHHKTNSYHPGSFESLPDPFRSYTVVFLSTKTPVLEQILSRCLCSCSGSRREARCAQKALQRSDGTNIAGVELQSFH